MTTTPRFQQAKFKYTKAMKCASGSNYIEIASKLVLLKTNKKFKCVKILIFYLICSHIPLQGSKNVTTFLSMWCHIIFICILYAITFTLHYWLNDHPFWPNIAYLLP